MQAVFLDRDGVIGVNRVDHVKSWDEFQFIPGALAALRWLHEAGLHTFVVTNQAIVNRGIVSPEIIEDMHSRMHQQIRQHGGLITDIVYCPHDTAEACACRKPQPGMLSGLAAKWGVDLARSYMVGDAWTDIAAGRRATCRTILVQTGRGNQQMHLPELRQHPADLLAADLSGAVEWIVQREGFAAPATERIGHQRVPSAAWVGTLQVGG